MQINLLSKAQVSVDPLLKNPRQHYTTMAMLKNLPTIITIEVLLMYQEVRLLSCKAGKDEGHLVCHSCRAQNVNFVNEHLVHPSGNPYINY